MEMQTYWSALSNEDKVQFYDTIMENETLRRWLVTHGTTIWYDEVDEDEEEEEVDPQSLF